ncbi:MAG TPA: DUF2807 domain-containing protein, partial [Sphingomicrobium sp.]
MRIHLLILLALTGLAMPAGAETRNFGVSGFDKVRVDGPFKVHLTTGVAPFAQATGSARAIDRVAVEVRGQTLIVHANRSAWGGYSGDNIGTVEVAIGTHDLSAATLNGSGSLDINAVKGLTFDLAVQGSGGAAIGEVDVDQLRVNVLGTASASLGGRAGKMTAIVRGISSLDAAGLTAKDATIGAEGAATVKAAVTNAVTIDGA